MGASSDGYKVRSGMSGQATELDGAGDDAGHIAEAIGTTECHTPDALGGADSAAAFDAFAAAWETDVTTLQSALHELAGKVRLAKGAYGGGDHTVAARAAAVPGDGLTTMPVPAGGSGLTTMPAYAERPSALTQY
ncbi:hypothetical protein JK361_23020 [Streptomyces sp. 5-8]|uniref:Excreted virulence factor EspC (Type VII ESX diderm) n=1 Tax=Streptomyces musisoli TaxID=2802280 RepID=A0ABS1P4Y9_9ACTN|nr:hypothetical protein [Streptomyces musisoli]MBL1107442.1 hypothetical protein [Streptomyces musisoli]